MKKIAFIFSLFCSFSLHAQSKISKQKTSVGINANTGFIYGELPNHHAMPGFGVSVNQKIGSVFSVSLQYNQLNYKGSADLLDVIDYYSASNYYGSLENVKSTTRSGQLQVLLGCDFTPQWMKSRNIEFKLLAGAGLGNFKGTLDYFDMRKDRQGGQNPNYTKRVTETYDGRHLYLPLGFGINYKAASNIIIQLQSTFNYLRSDNIDLLNNWDSNNRYYDRFFNINAGCAYVF